MHPPFPLQFGDVIEHTLPDLQSSAFLAGASQIWKRRREVERHVVMGTYNGQLYAMKDDGSQGCRILPLDDADNMRVVERRDVIPMSSATIAQLQRELRLRKRKASDSDKNHRKAVLQDALRLTDAPAFPPPGLPQVSEEVLVRECIPQVLDFVFHQFCERFGESKIPDASVRLVVNWMLSWFGCSLRFDESKRDGLLKLAAIEVAVLKRPIPIPTLIDFDVYRVRRHAEQIQAMKAWNVPPAQLAEWLDEAFLYCMPRVEEAQAINHSLRHMPKLEQYVAAGEVPPAALLPHADQHRPRPRHSPKDSGLLPPNADRATLAKTSRALLDMAQQKRKRQNEAAKVLQQQQQQQQKLRKSEASSNPVTEDETLPTLVAEAHQAGLQQLRRYHEAQLASHVAGNDSPSKVTTRVQDASKVYRYKTSDGGLIFLDSSDDVCFDVFQMRRGEVYQYASGDMEGVHVVILGVVEGALWRYEEKLSSQDRVMDEQAHPFLGRTGEEIRHSHDLRRVSTMEPRTCDPFYFPRLEGALVKFDIEEASCSLYGVHHGQRFVMKKEPFVVPSLPTCRHGPIVTVIGVYSQNIYFAADNSGAFNVNSNDPVKDLGLEPLYFTVVGAFAVERKNWFRCPVEITKRQRTYVVSVCMDTTPSLLDMFHPQFRFGTVVRIPADPQEIQAWKAQQLAALTGGAKKKLRALKVAVASEPPPEFVVAQIVGVRANTLYRAALHEDLARPLTPYERSNLTILSEAELHEEFDGGPLKLKAQCPIAVRAERQQEELFAYVDTSGNDSGLVLRPQTKFKAFNTFHELCLYDQSDEMLRPFGVSPFDWVKIFVAQRWKWAVIVGVRAGCLWRIDEDNIGVLAEDLRFQPIAELEEAHALNAAFQRARSSIPRSVPVTAIFNHCNTHKDLVKRYSMVLLGSAKMRGFVG